MDRSFFRDEEHEWVKSIKFNDLAPMQLYNLILQKQQLGARSQAVLFDLDSTLFNLGRRNQQILGDFLRTLDVVPLHWHRLYAELGRHNHEYFFEKTFLRIFKSWNAEKATEWNEDLMREFMPFWEKRFFSNWPLFYDEPYPGAVDFVSAFARAGFEIIYLTGRDRPGGQGGTIGAIKKWNFPWNLQSHLFMKPAKILPDLEFKAQVSDVIRSRFDLVLSIDNEPENCVMFAEKFPAAEVVFFHSIMSKRVPRKDYRQVLGERLAHRLSGY